MKGIVLAGGRGTRLYPMTQVVSKQLLPIYDKPMIYYPISVLLLAGIREILILSTPQDLSLYQSLLGDGTRFGVRFSYLAQPEPHGIAEAFLLGEPFIGRDPVCLILGDNVLYGQGLTELLQITQRELEEATIFAYPVKNPSEFGVVAFDADGKATSIEEKPDRPKSNYAVPGLYFYHSEVCQMAKKLQPSARGELEISALNALYLARGTLSVRLLGRGFAWLDTGTPQGLLQAASYVEAMQSRQCYYVACLEEIAWRKGYIDNLQLRSCAQNLDTTEYGRYLFTLLEESP